jgi:hypothetical protein
MRSETRDRRLPRSEPQASEVSRRQAAITKELVEIVSGAEAL